jgi:hypothetical protein
MNNVHRAYLASVVCLAGATIQIIYGLLAIPFGPYTEMDAGWDEILWALVNVGFIAGALGLLFLDVGRPRRLAVIGAAVSVLASLSRIVASIIIMPNLVKIPSHHLFSPAFCCRCPVWGHWGSPRSWASSCAAGGHRRRCLPKDACSL